MNDTIIIAGAGQAGTQAAISLRDLGYGGRILLVGDETDLPYQRPPLSKTYLKSGASLLPLRAEKIFADKQIELLRGVSVVSIDRAAREVRLSSGQTENYAHLILALGGSNRKFPGDSEGILMLRTRSDADRIRERIAEQRRVVIIGAGFVGLEVASSLRGLGHHVTVVDIAPRVLARSVSAPTSEFVHALHEANGVVLRCDARSVSYEPLADGKAEVRLAGEVIPADIVFAGIGIEPNVAVAAASGLETRNGIVVDEFLSTADPAVFAIGDCAAFQSAYAKSVVRIESVQNAVDQAKFVAALIMGNRQAAYRAVPWFWSDQHNVKLQIAGLIGGHDEAILRGSVADKKFSVYCFREGQCVAIESINAPADHMDARKLLAGSVPLTKQAFLAPDFSLKGFLAGNQPV
ncbi:MAG TPA: FAD-dependent oxidoreductase [Xanthobacteraceae bacterium]|nr:FAD-dependent oxidoreductase [Xanthobacteraceae bacterium]